MPEAGVLPPLWGLGIGQFMGRQIFRGMDTHWDHEPGRGALTPALSHLRFAAEGEGGRDGRFMESCARENTYCGGSVAMGRIQR